jgi:hypothetical protein
MFYYFYQLCVALFLVQGVSISLLLLTVASVILVIVYAIKNR